MFQIDPTKTGDENFLTLVNSIVVDRKFRSQELHIMAILDITPSVENGQSNTQLNLRGTAGTGWQGTTEVVYTRLDLATQRLTAGKKLYITSEMTTHAAVHAAIIALHGLVADQVTFVDPVRIPVPGETLNYTVNQAVSSVIYVPGSLTIAVTNIDDFVPLTSADFFGPALLNHNHNGLPIHVFNPTSLKEFADPTQTSRNNFIRMLNHFSKFNTVVQFTETDLNLGVNEPGGVGGGTPGNTFVDVTFIPGGLISNPFTILYTRENPAFDASWDSDGFPDSFKGPVAPALSVVVSDFECFPVDAFTRGAVTGDDNGPDSGDRSISFTWLDNQYLVLGGGSTEYDYFW